jgi:hypothetical protein
MIDVLVNVLVQQAEQDTPSFLGKVSDAATVVVHTQQSEFTLSTSNYRSRYYWECPACTIKRHLFL